MRNELAERILPIITDKISKIENVQILSTKICGFHKNNEILISLYYEKQNKKTVLRGELWKKINAVLATIDPRLYAGIQNGSYVVRLRSLNK